MKGGDVSLDSMHHIYCCCDVTTMLNDTGFHLLSYLI